MAKFLTPLEVRCLDDGKNWMLLGELQFETADGRVICVPAGIIIDFASTPRFFWRLFPPATGRHRRAAAPHDWIYKTPDVAISKADADDFFLQGMIADNTKPWIRNVLYRAVHHFGGSSYKPRTAVAEARIADDNVVRIREFDA